jgi:chromosome segregation ATPase
LLYLGARYKNEALVANGVKEMSVTIEQDLKEYLSKEFDKINQQFGKIDQQFEKIDQRFDEVNQELKEIKEDIVDLKVGQAELKGEMTAIKVELSNVEKNVSRLETSQNAQLWTLIVAIVGAIITTVIKLWSSGNP